MKTFKWLALAGLVLVMVVAAACSSDDDDGTGPTAGDVWVGNWLSAEENVAPILVALFDYDSVHVAMDEDQIVTLETHVRDGAWATISGTYAVTESDEGDVHSIELIYAAFSQAGIIEVTDGSPDVMRLEVVQTVPDIGAIPRTPETGFGSDPGLGDSNIQTYIRID